MKQVIILSLDNKAYHVDEDAYAALHQYLDSAKAALQNNPDAGEILGDVERSIGTKCAATLHSAKNVVSFEEMTAILEEVGPVEADSSAPREEFRSNGPAQPKRLYRQPKGAVVEGVCTGLAEYFNIDVVIFRIIFVVLAMASVGVALYFVMMIAVPSLEPEKPKTQISTYLRRVHPAILLSGALLLLLLALTLLPWMNRELAFQTGGFSSSGTLGVLSLLLFVMAIVLGYWGFSNRATRQRPKE